MFRRRRCSTSVLACLALGLVAPRLLAQGEVRVREGTLACGIETRPETGSSPPHLHVTWIRWDSAFRGSGLEVGDEIVAVDGRAIAFPEDTVQLQRTVQRSIGQTSESQGWAEAGATDGTKVTLTARRRVVPGEGWRTFEVAGAVRNVRAHVDADGRATLGPGGPQEYASDGFPSSWSSWYDSERSKAQRALDGIWASREKTRSLLEEHLPGKVRVDWLVAHRPGPFTEAVASDWERVRTTLEGRRYEIAPEELEWRRLGESRAGEIAEAGARAREAFLAAHQAEVVEAFPAPDPIHDDRKHLDGRLVVLPAAGNRNWVTDAGHNYLTWTGAGGRYFADCESAAARRLFHAAHRYEGLVVPDVAEEYSIVGRVRPDARLVMVAGRPEVGLEVDLEVVSIGEALFVDLTREEDGVSRFAGEEALLAPQVPRLADDAPPRQVFEAFVASIKAGDQAGWAGLFASWRAVELGPGRVRLHPYVQVSADAEWVRSRRLLLESVCDVRVVWVSDVRTVMTGEEFEGAPVVEEVTIEVDHVGTFGPECRAFTDVRVNRSWTLQRLAGGPWRITSIQNM